MSANLMEAPATNESHAANAAADGHPVLQVKDLNFYYGGFHEINFGRLLRKFQYRYASIRVVCYQRY